MRKPFNRSKPYAAVLVAIASLAFGGVVSFGWAARRAYHWTYVNGETYILRISGWGGDIYDCERARRCAQSSLGTSQVYCSQSGTYIEVPEQGQGELHEVSCN